MNGTVLGLDIGGANLKAATATGRAETLPFALWKYPDRLPAILAELVAKFPEATELAVTMTGELCDCYETKRQGVHAILDAVESVCEGRLVRIWGTDGAFHSIEQSRAAILTVAASNWHALATFAGRFAPHHGGLLIDIGSTTSDLIPLDHGVPSTLGMTDFDRLRTRELVYIGVRRTPIMALGIERLCAEYFATTHDVYTVLGLIPEEPENRDTADNRPATVEYALARLARMLGGDRDTFTDDQIVEFAIRVHKTIVERLAKAATDVRFNGSNPPELKTIITSGAGEFLVKSMRERLPEGANVISLSEKLGPVISTCAPAYALAILGTERRP